MDTIYQIKKFIISGGSATFVHLFLMYFLVLLNIYPLISTSAGVIAGAFVNYMLQYYYTFDSDTNHKRSVNIYLIAVGLSFLSNFILFAVFHTFLYINVIVSQLLTSVIVAIQNFILYKKFVFLKIKQHMI